jgi:N-acyl-D-aspartate/D-glutamate deacylase
VLDLLIRNGMVIDGTGNQRRPGEVGVQGGKIVAVGPRVDEPARQAIDAHGLVVAPGFVDVHSHYDAQVWWDRACSPSPSHGVTTVITGNCGLTMAPVRPGDEEWLAKLFSKVEAMSIDALNAGVPFGWQSYGELLDALSARGVGINMGVMVGHSTVRRYVMGDAASERNATADELDEMCSVLAECLAAGGFGFSTANPPTQVDGDGRPTPPNYATREELIRLSGVVGRHEGTCIEFIAGSFLNGFTEDDINLMADMSATANRHLNWNTPLPGRGDLHLRQMRASDIARDRGGWVVPTMNPGRHPVRMDFLSAYTFRVFPGWGDVCALPPKERVKALAENSVRRQLEQGLEGATEGLALAYKDPAAWGNYVVNDVEDSSLQGLVGKTVAEIARERGSDSYFDTILDIVVEADLDMGFAMGRPEGQQRGDPSMVQARADLLRDERVVYGASDSGAHLDMMVQADFATRTLADVVRDDQIISLEEAVRRLSDQPARLYGLRNRGRIAEGYWADIAVFDPDTVTSSPMRLANDFPAGARRLVTDAVGVEWVFVNGTPAVVEGKATGEGEGRVLRSGRDSETVLARADSRSGASEPTRRV